MQGNTRLTKKQCLAALAAVLLTLSSCGSTVDSDGKEIVLTRGEGEESVSGISDPHSTSMTLFSKSDLPAPIQKSACYGICFSTSQAVTGVEVSSGESKTDGYVAVKLYSYVGDYSKSIRSTPLVEDEIYVEKNKGSYGVYFSKNIKNENGSYLLLFITENDGINLLGATRTDDIEYYVNGENCDTSFAFTAMLYG